ncbi:hypothetical protein LINPERHAP1_LOCUS26463 [Linum perenne]
MGKSLLLLHHNYRYCCSFPVIATRINYSAAGQNNSSDHRRKTRRFNYDPPKLNINNHTNKHKKKIVELKTDGGGDDREGKIPLSEVVSECERQWFEDTLRDAEAGNTDMQVLVGRMYSSGYGVPKDVSKGRAWIDMASKTQSSASRLGDKHPGYNTCDSESEEVDSY